MEEKIDLIGDEDSILRVPPSSGSNPKFHPLILGEQALQPS
jgi:hypothetical protein